MGLGGEVVLVWVGLPVLGQRDGFVVQVDDVVKYYGSREGRRYYGLPTGVPCARHSRVLLEVWYYRARKGQYWSGVHPLPVAAQYAPAL